MRTRMGCFLLSFCLVAPPPGQDRKDPAGAQSALALEEQATAHYLQGKLSQAEPLYRRVVEIYEKAAEPQDRVLALSLATALNNLGAIEYASGKYARAEELLRRALHIRENIVGLDHPAVALTLTSLGEVVRIRARYGEAEELHLRASRITYRTVGPKHPDTATVLTNLGFLYQSQGRYAEAESCLQRALSILQQTVGPDDPAIARSQVNLGSLYIVQGSFAKAEQVLNRARASYEKLFGPESVPPEVLYNLAKVYRRQGKLDPAESLCLRVLAVADNSSHTDDPAAAAALTVLAGVYYDRHRYAEAEPLLKRALTLSEDRFGPGHWAVARLLEQYAQLLRKMKRKSEAAQIQARASSLLHGPPSNPVSNTDSKRKK
jgi:tetratricopeptide (TPR) repeat protein